MSSSEHPAAERLHGPFQPYKFPRTPDHRLRSVVSFTLPSTGERWNWPVATSDKEAIDAFCEILDRADIPWKVSHA